MINSERMINNFMEMVKIDSVSGKERQFADYLKGRLAELGLKAHEDDAGKLINTSCGNIIAIFPGNVDGIEPLLLSAHMDTVEPGQGIVPVLEDGVIRSAGNTVLGADNKAGIVAILEAIRVLQENNLPHGDLEIVFTVFEEGGLLGSKNLDTSGLSARRGYVLDGDGDPGSIIVKAPSQDRISAMITGRAAHAGVNPEDGINAIQVASKAIAEMQLGRIDQETTANIGIISGGKAINIVPEAVSITGEARSLDEAKRKRQTQAMVDALNRAAKQFSAGAEIKVETIYGGFSLTEENQVVALALRAAGKAGLNSFLTQSGGGSDANILNNRGIETANLGIGMRRPHTSEEYIKVDDLFSSARFLLAIIDENTAK